MAAYYRTPRASNSSKRLYAARDAVPALAAAIAGPDATVTLVAWVQRNGTNEGMIAGVWDEYGKARQYALFTALGACGAAPKYSGGLAAHISPVGGPTPGQRFCTTAACDPRPIPLRAWECLANVYDGTAIRAYVNATLAPNHAWNPFPLTGGIYSPEAAQAFGAEFALFANRINVTAGGPPMWSNRWEGFIGGVAVWSEALTAAQVAEACALGAGF